MMDRDELAKIIREHVWICDGPESLAATDAVLEALASMAARQEGGMWRRFALSETSAAEALGYVSDWLRDMKGPKP